MQGPFSLAISYGLLSVAYILLWLPLKSFCFRQYNIVAVLASLMALFYGVLFGFLGFAGLGLLLLFGCACFCVVPPRSIMLRVIAACAVFFLAAAFLGHVLPGFPAVSLFASIRTVGNGAMFSYDKAAAGFFIVAFGGDLLREASAWKVLARGAGLTAAVTIFLVVFLTWATGLGGFAPHWTPRLIPWAWSNLFFVCIPEEAFFRGLVQKYLANLAIRFNGAGWIGVLIAGLVFGLTHGDGGIKSIAIATVAGCGYGILYQRTRAIESSIVTHFVVNAASVFLFA
ncbi:MAG: CPBP family intramembrane metalloprotease [Chitinivibrionales bacterium]|nr:CPBP family intramembrane metalloprotease [Chitinivibrionales bacterium]